MFDNKIYKTWPKVSQSRLYYIFPKGLCAMTSSVFSSKALRIASLGAALALGLAWGPALHAQATATRELAIDASSLSPSSPEQWRLSGVVTLPGAAGGLDLALDPSFAAYGSSDPGAAVPDLYLSFDGALPEDAAARWTVKAEGPYRASSADEARFGKGSGVFRAPSTKLTLSPVRSELLEPGQLGGDFSLEFWLRPTKAENGEIILLWKSSQLSGKAMLAQQLTALVQRNRMSFGFLNFFANPTGKGTAFSLQGSSVLVPGRWAHHLLRYDSATGLLEYLMDGKPEAISYTTATGRQGGTVFLPLPGSAGRLELAPNYTGFLDEFRLSEGWIERPKLARYEASGGRAVSPIFDLGAANSAITRIDIQAIEPGESAIHWSFRAADSSAAWRDEEPAWTAFKPGGDALGPDGKPALGRYVQIRAELYPDASGERSPRVAAMRIRYEPDLPPPPPAKILLTPVDGAIRVDWSPVVESDLQGYVLYYGHASREYFGEGALQGPSPIWVPGRDSTSFTLKGLRNGALYFIAVAAYDGASPPHVGEFSREASARPSRVSK